MDREKLIRQIRHAFAHNPKPDCTLRVARGADDHDYDWEKLRKLDDHYTAWEEVPAEDLERYNDVFLWLCSKGYKFYLPAYMVNALKCTPQEVNHEIWSSWAFHETCVEGDYFKLFTREELEVTLHFVEWLFSEVQDGYHEEWWHHPWNKDWNDDDERKAELWGRYGLAYQHLTAKLAEKNIP